MSMETLTTFLGWSFLINCGILCLTTVLIITMKRPVMKAHASLFALDDDTLNQANFRYLAQYKALILTMYLAPYLALKMMG